MSLDGHLHLKHAHSGFGKIRLFDLVNGVICVVDKETGAETVFANTESLMCAGWVID